jgi:Calcineurin-like phosphoesterase
VTSSDRVGEKKTSRRDYIKWVGSIVAVGAVGIVLGGVAEQLAGQKDEQTVTDPVIQTSTATSTATDTETLTDTQTDIETVTNTQTETQTLTDTQTQAVTSTQTETQTLTDTQTEIVTASATSSSSSTISTTSQSSTATDSFSIFWITDTQFLSESNPGLFAKMTSWIVENWEAYNGKMVIHTGDVVQIGDQQSEWENANEAMSTLLQNEIPYTWCAGNHDDLVGDDATSGWSGNVWADAFDPALVSLWVNTVPYAAWAGDFHDGMNTALSFSANGLNFLVINVEWNAQADVLKWVGGLLDDPRYADHHVIMAPHAYLNAFGDILDSSNYIDLTSFVDGLTSLMDAHSSNVFLTLNGHYATDRGYNTGAPVNGRNELMFDRQDCTDKPGDPTGRGIDAATSTTPDAAKLGGSTVTILTFDTANNKIDVTTYDVNTSTWRTNQDEQYSITMFPAPISTSATNGSVLTATPQ